MILWSLLMLLLSVSMSWICFRNAVLNPLYVGKATYSNKEKFGILEDNLKPPLVHQKAEPHRFSQLRSPLMEAWKDIEVDKNLREVLVILINQSISIYS